MSVLSRVRRATILGAVLLALLVPAALLSAQEPKVTAEVASRPNLIAASSLPDAIRDAQTLKNSLSDKQLKATRAILRRYSAEIAALSQQLPALSQAAKPASEQSLAELAPSTGRQPTSADVPAVDGFSTDANATQALLDSEKARFQLVQQVDTQSKAVLAKIETEITAQFTPDQLKLHQSAIRPAQAPALPNTDAAAQNDATVQYSSSYCYAAAQFSAYGRYYSYVGYYYAYYDYIAGSRSGNAYNAYYYLYYGQAYANSGHLTTSAGFFNVNTLGGDPDNYVSAGYTNEYNAAVADYYGWNYALTDYNNTRNAYAKSAYEYGYAGYYNTYYSYAYGVAC